MQKCERFFESLDRALSEREIHKNAPGGAEMFELALPQALSIAAAYRAELSKRGYALSLDPAPQRLDLALSGPAPDRSLRASLFPFGPGLAFEFVSECGGLPRRAPAAEWDPTVFEGLLQNLIEKLVLHEGA